MLMLGKALRTVWCRFGSWSLVTWWCRVCLFICFCSTFSCCNIDWSYEQHELTGVTSVYKAEIESVKWNFHFFYTKRTIMVAPWKSFQRGTSPECLPLVSSSPLVLCSSLPLGSSSPANASQLELDGIDTSMGTPTSPQTLWFQDERQRGAPLRDRSTKRCPIQRARRGGGPPTWWQMAREERLQSPCCWWCSHKVKF